MSNENCRAATAENENAVLIGYIKSEEVISKAIATLSETVLFTEQIMSADKY